MMEINHSIVLEYLKLILSWPCITLVIVLVVMRKYGETIKGLFPRLRSVKALGTEAAFDAAALVETVVEETIQLKREQIQELPDSGAKEEKIAVLELEAQQLRTQLTEALENQLVGDTALPSGEKSNKTFKQILLFNTLTRSCGDVIARWIIENNIQASHGRRFTYYRPEKMYELIMACRRKAPEVLASHSMSDIQAALTEILLAKAPLAPETSVATPKRAGTSGPKPTA